MKRTPLLVALVLTILSAACRPDPAASPTAAPTAVVPTSAPEPATAAAIAPTIAASAPSPTEAPAGPTAPPEVETPPLFDVAPADRSIYAAGLTTAEQSALSEQPGAPVYHMAITIDESMTIVSGRQTVTYTNLEDVPLSELYFHLHAETLDGAITVLGRTADGLPVEAADESGVLRVPLPAELAPGETTTVEMQFVTRVPTEIGRNYGVLTYYEDILALAHFYPMLAVYDDEGWNTAKPDIQGDLTYSDAAFYLVEVTAPADTVLVGAGSIIDQASDDGTQTLTFALGPARDFYLAAGDFISVSETVGETTVNSYAPVGFEDGASAALDAAIAALTENGARLSPYPYSELDIVTTPTSALGIEYPGLIVGTLRMYDLKASTQAGVPYSVILEATTAHEVSHQWFYNLVGNDQLDEPWLDEAVTSYTAYRYYVDRYGQKAGDEFFETFYGRWDRVDRAEIPVGMPVANYEEAEYSAIVYGRGPIFLRELEEEMGQETFDGFLSDYTEKYRWLIADSAGFRALAEEHCDCDLGPLFEEWIYE